MSLNIVSRIYIRPYICIYVLCYTVVYHQFYVEHGLLQFFSALMAYSIFGLETIRKEFCNMCKVSWLLWHLTVHYYSNAQKNDVCDTHDNGNIRANVNSWSNVWIHLSNSCLERVSFSRSRLRHDCLRRAAVRKRICAGNNDMRYEQTILHNRSLLPNRLFFWTRLH